MSIKTVIERIKLKANEEVKKKAIRVAIVVDQALVLATPVDTGRAKGNWQLTLGAPEVSTRDVVDKTGGATISQAVAVLKDYQVDQSIFITNNLPYIMRLNNGHSKQAPAGFVEKAVQAAHSLR